jgi:hypothetical protein
MKEQAQTSLERDVADLLREIAGDYQAIRSVSEQEDTTTNSERMALSYQQLTHLIGGRDALVLVTASLGPCPE